jgi:hypothetical protein
LALPVQVWGRIKLMALGKYPEVSLKRARELHAEAKHLQSKGVDPMADRKAQKTEAESATDFNRLGESLKPIYLCTAHSRAADDLGKSEQ